MEVKPVTQNVVRPIAACDAQISNTKKALDINNMPVCEESYIGEFSRFSHLYIMITHNCNFACKYCFNVTSKKIIDLDVATKAVDLMMAHNTTGEASITFFGGEPLMGIDRIIEIKEYCLSRYPDTNWSWSMTTNFSLLTEKVIKNVLMDEKMSVMVSLDGDRDHNAERVFPNGEPTFDVVMNNLEKAGVFGDFRNRITIRATFSAKSTSTIFDRFKFLADKFGSNFVMMMVDDESWDEVNYEEYKEQVLKTLGYSLEKGIDLGTIKFFSDSIESYKNENFGFHALKKSCGQAFHQFAVDESGQISPCHRFTNISIDGDDTYVIGSVFQGLFYDKIKWIRSLNSFEENGCESLSCPIRFTCSFTCFAAGVLSNDDHRPSCHKGLQNLYIYNRKIIEEELTKNPFLSPQMAQNITLPSEDVKRIITLQNEEMSQRMSQVTEKVDYLLEINKRLWQMLYNVDIDEASKESSTPKKEEIS